MKMVMSRTYGENETKSTIFVMDGDKKLLELKAIELPDNNNQRSSSCIPEGTYAVIKYTSPSKGLCFHVLDVPDRDSILIHKGNYASLTGRSDTLGCILPGMYFTDLNGDENPDVAESTKAMNKLLLTLPDSFKLIII